MVLAFRFNYQAYSIIVIYFEYEYTYNGRAWNYLSDKFQLHEAGGSCQVANSIIILKHKADDTQWIDI